MMLAPDTLCTKSKCQTIYSCLHKAFLINKPASQNTHDNSLHSLHHNSVLLIPFKLNKCQFALVFALQEHWLHSYRHSPNKNFACPFLFWKGGGGITVPILKYTYNFNLSENLRQKEREKSLYSEI